MFPLVSTLLALAASTSALPTATSRPLTEVKSVTTLARFPSTWLENLAVRSNGDILATTISPGPYSVYVFNPSTNKTCGIFSSGAGRSASGIVEVAPDVFAVNTFHGNVPDLSGGGCAIYTFDLRHLPECRGEPLAAPSRVVAELPRAGLLNGLTALPETRTLLSADSQLGLVWRIDLASGGVDIALNSSATQALGPPVTIPGSNVSFVNAVNGVHARAGMLYLTNTQQGLFARQAIDARGSPRGQTEVLVRNVTADDFALPPLISSQHGEGKAGYLAFVPQEGISFVNGADGTNDFLASIAGATAAVFGRLKGDEKSLYVSASGGDGRYVSGGSLPDGTITRIELA